MESINWDTAISVFLIFIGLLGIWGTRKLIKEHVARVAQARQELIDWPVQTEKAAAGKASQEIRIYVDEVEIPESLAKRLGLYPHLKLSTESVGSLLEGLAFLLIGLIGLAVTTTAMSGAFFLFKILAVLTKIGLWVYRKLRWEYGGRASK